MKTSDIRKAFLDFFNSKNHEVVASSSLVPSNDETLLFTNAGMVQFKDVFLGTETKNFKRAATSQRCIRAGGKHNDCLLYTSPSPRDTNPSRMPSSA